jgi:hypothetical protein
MQTKNVFAGPYLERVSHLRADPAWFDDALADARSRVVPMWDSRSLVADGPIAVLLELSEIPADRRNRGERTAIAGGAAPRPCREEPAMCSCVPILCAAMSSSRASIRPSLCW